MGGQTKRAIISVSDKRGIGEFGKGLATLGWEILSTGGTAKALAEAGVKVVPVSEYTGAQEILGGRVKTLHPKVHGGILAKDTEDHAKELTTIGAGYIDMVCVNLYPFVETIAKDGVTMSDALENIDIGGPTMMRAAAKNWPRVLAVCDPNDYEVILRELEQGQVDDTRRQQLAAKVFAHTAAYDSAITTHLSSDGATKEAATLPTTWQPQMTLASELRYGENPHQVAGLYVERTPSLAAAKPLSGKALSYNNLLDIDAALNCCREFEQPAAVVIKHTNPCGAATADSIVQAYVDARSTDPVSAFGSIVAINRTVEPALAEVLAETFLECIVAPRFSAQAVELLTKKKNLRLLEVDFAGSDRFATRSIDGGLLVQSADAPASIAEAKVVTARKPTAAELASLDFAWRCVKHVKSNAIVFANGTKLLGVGAGQMSRVDSVKLAARKANESLEGSVLASDAFFPFRDGVDEAAAAGVKAIVQPGGSKRDPEVIEAANEHGIAMIMTGQRHFRH